MFRNRITKRVAASNSSPDHHESDADELEFSHGTYLLSLSSLLSSHLAQVDYSQNFPLTG